MQNIFQEKDYMNGRFFHKRAFYLATLAAAVQDSKSLNVDVAYDSAFNDPRLTKLVLEPRKGAYLLFRSFVVLIL
jgi:U3 small nucleolar RNA-associated protein 22